MGPSRFDKHHVIVRWLAEIVGFQPAETKTAREIPFMQSKFTNNPAGKIYLVVGRQREQEDLRWYGLEIQAAYFSEKGMTSQFEVLQNDALQLPPYTARIRRPDWRSSSEKRLMPQIQIKVPTARRWQTKMAVAVDQQFFEAMGGPSPQPSQDLNDGDIIWLVPQLVFDDATRRYQLQRGHHEVLTLEDSCKLQAAQTVSRDTFEAALKAATGESPAQGSVRLRQDYSRSFSEVSSAGDTVKENGT